MSDPRTKAEKSKAKDARQGRPSPPEVTGKPHKKKEKPIHIEYRHSDAFYERNKNWISRLSSGNKWSIWGKYRNLKEAEMALKSLQNKDYHDMYEYRINP